jgi:hypothetical protein
MKKILLALLCGGLLAMPSMANAAKHKRPHASKRVKRHKRAARTTIAQAEPTAPIVKQVRDDESPHR